MGFGRDWTDPVVEKARRVQSMALCREQQYFAVVDDKYIHIYGHLLACFHELYGRQRESVNRLSTQDADRY